MSYESHIDSLSNGIDMLTNLDRGVVTATKNPDIFKVNTPPAILDRKPIVVFTGPSQAGKDTIVSAVMDAGDDVFCRLKTATSRKRRETETVDAMTWLRPPQEGEAFNDYVLALTEEYDLIECTPHSGSVYGLPRQNLLDVPEGMVPVLNTDVDGIKRISDQLAATHALTSFIVCPDNGRVLVDRIARLGVHVDERIADADRYIAEAMPLVHFAIRNPESHQPTETARRLGCQVIATLREIGVFSYTGRGTAER